MEQRDNNGGFLTGMIVGAAAGAAIALLYTPRSGRRAVEALKARGVDLDKVGGGALSAQRDRLGHAVDEAKKAAERTRQDILGRYEAAKGDAHPE